MVMNERELIQEILNTVDVLYDFKNADEDKKKYTLLLNLQKGDNRKLESINSEMKNYFKEAKFTYDEVLNLDDSAAIKIDIAKE
jgi:hypothetical protein